MSLKKFDLQINGMTCQSCEVIVERKFKEVPGVVKVNVDHRTGKAQVLSREMPNLREFNDVIADEPYSVSAYDGGGSRKNRQKDAGVIAEPGNHAETGAIALLIFGLYFFFSQLGIFGGISSGITPSMSYGFIFLIGLVAATSSCIAVTGGLLISISAAFAESHPDLSGWQKFKPHVLFNAGRVVGYALLGGAVGALGSTLTISPQMTGVITIVVSFFMIVMALSMLKISWVSRLQVLRMPKSISHAIHDWSAKPGVAAPFIMGAATFFLPCGFTQTLQLYAFSTGSFFQGAATMLIFALGTLPALVSLGAITSFAKGSFSRIFMKSAGVFVLILGFSNINNGLALTGSNWSFARIGDVIRQSGSMSAQAPTADPNITIEGDTQVARMEVDGTVYRPDHFTVYAGMPVRWIVNGKNTYSCAGVLTVPTYNIVKVIEQGKDNEITFLPTEPGEVRFTCSMGMYGGSFTVVPKPV